MLCGVWEYKRTGKDSTEEIERKRTTSVDFCRRDGSTHTTKGDLAFYVLTVVATSNLRLFPAMGA